VYTIPSLSYSAADASGQGLVGLAIGFIVVSCLSIIVTIRFMVQWLVQPPRSVPKP
jgi:hypothetical protein